MFTYVESVNPALEAYENYLLFRIFDNSRKVDHVMTEILSNCNEIF